MDKEVNLKEMKRIGIITVAKDRIDREEYEIMTKDRQSLNQKFFERMQICTYKRGKDCILSMNDDDNLILAHFDDDAIFLLSENEVLSPKQFVNLMINLQNCCSEMRFLIQRNSREMFSDFELAKLNINFANIEIATEMQKDIIKQSFQKIEEELAQIDVEKTQLVENKYNEIGSISHKYSSQYGICIITFLNQMIKSNPDIRLLMSNVCCRKQPIDLYDAIIKAVNEVYPYIFVNPDEKEKLLKQIEKIFKLENRSKQEEFKRAFEERKATEIRYRTENNEKYEVYPALKYIIASFEETQNIDEEYTLEWYDGNPDIGNIAINYALNNMSKSMRSGNNYNGITPRNNQAVLQYMKLVEEKTHNLNKDIKQERKERQKVRKDQNI